MCYNKATLKQYISRYMLPSVRKCEEDEIIITNIDYDGDTVVIEFEINGEGRPYECVVRRSCLNAIQETSNG